MLVRHLVPCREIVVSRDQREDLLGVASFVERPPLGVFPCEIPCPFKLYLVATSLRKDTEVWLEWVYLADQDFTYHWGSAMIPGVRNPAEEVMIPLRLPFLPLRSPGQYEVRLWVDRIVVASVPLMVED